MITAVAQETQTGPAMPRGRTLRAFFTARRWQGRPYLISPAADFLMVGGLGIFLIPLLALFVPTDVVNDVSIQKYSVFLAGLVTYHVFAINYPHFAFSYQIAYRRFGRCTDTSLPRTVRWRYLFALIGFPVMFVAYAAYALTTSSVAADGSPGGRMLLGFLVNLMFLTVGWHYCKQCFGILMVMSALKGIYFTRWERRVLLMNAMLVWLVSWVGGNIALGQHQFWGVPYETLALGSMMPLPLHELMPIHRMMMRAVQLLGLVSFIVILRNGVRQKKRPSITGITGFLMMYPLILLGYTVHPFWFWIVPAIHSLQYFPFVLAYKRNEIALKNTQSVDGAEALPLPRRKHLVFGVFLGLAVAIGAAQFSWLPQVFDALVAPEHKLHLPLMGMALFHLFVNIHHYFIDNVIWRKENPEVGRYLMHKDG